MIVNIQPTSISRTWTIQSVFIKIQDIIPNESASFAIGYIDENGEYISNPGLIYNVTISGEEYAQWNSNDGYILNIIFSKINLTPIST